METTGSFGLELVARSTVLDLLRLDRWFFKDGTISPRDYASRREAALELLRKTAATAAEIADDRPSELIVRVEGLTSSLWLDENGQPLKGQEEESK